MTRQPSRPRHASALLTAVACAIAGCLDAAGGLALESSPQAARLVNSADAQIVLEWNELAYDIAYAEDQFLTFKGQRALALMNLAMHDALNTIVPKYERFAFRGATRAADPALSAAQAASVVLRTQYPAAVARLDSVIALQTELVAPNRQTASIELGTAVAEAVLRVRSADGWDASGSYRFNTAAGQYQTTPDWKGFVLQPGFRHARPFALRAPDAFRPPPPPPLTSTTYVRAYDEVKTFGSVSSADRTHDQSGYAIWWLEFAEASVNRLARRLTTERLLDLWSAARMFAQMHIALYDGYIATWDAKYEYNHWRPFTAIRAEDGNDKTASDTAWQSLRPAPPFPEYVSAHATGCAAAFTILASVWPDAQSFKMTTLTAPPGMRERAFADFGSAAAECADSRVRLGWHFRYSTDAGQRLGERVARHVLGTQLRATTSQ